MKSNLSKKEIESGQEIIKKISELNLTLLPDNLKQIISDYQKFQPHPQKKNFWIKTKTKKKLKQKYDKILLLLSGLTASGKDAVFEKINQLSPNLLFKTVTATSRPPRENEIHGHDYYFYENHQVFRQSIKNGELLEFIKRGESYYGLPKESLKNSLNQATPVVYSQIEMSGWSKTEKYLKKINQTNILILKMFILPEMSFFDYQNWLSQKRNDTDLESRIHKTGWEIKKAAKKSDILLINQFHPGNNSIEETSKNIIDQITEILK